MRKSRMADTYFLLVRRKFFGLMNMLLKVHHYSFLVMEQMLGIYIIMKVVLMLTSEPMCYRILVSIGAIYNTIWSRTYKGVFIEKKRTATHHIL